MSKTNLALGSWRPGEWPECITVSHEGMREPGRRYVPERTCKVAHRYDLGGEIGEHAIWYECGAMILLADGIPDPAYCPGCGGRIE